MSQSWVGQNHNESKCHAVTSWYFFLNFRMDEQSVHFGSKCHSSKTLKRRNVVVVKRYREEMSCSKMFQRWKCEVVKHYRVKMSRKTSQKTKCWVDVLCGSKCCVIVLWVYISSRYPNKPLFVAVAGVSNSRSLTLNIRALISHKKSRI